MNSTTHEETSWKQRVAQEVREYALTFIYLATFLAVFTWYRRLILAEYQITYLHYWIAIIEAFVMAKVVRVGDALHLGRGFETRPLIFPTLYKATVFSLFVGLFAILEHTVEALLHGKGFAAGFHQSMSVSKDELLARCLLTFFAFIPFFAFKELARVMGRGKLHGLFFHRR